MPVGSRAGGPRKVYSRRKREKEKEERKTERRCTRIRYIPTCYNVRERATGFLDIGACATGDPNTHPPSAREFADRLSSRARGRETT